jgi:hypothetical protein
MRTTDHRQYMILSVGGTHEQSLLFAQVDENGNVISDGISNMQLFHVLIDRICSQRNYLEGELSLTHLRTALEWLIRNTAREKESLPGRPSLTH